ncbi:phospholipase/carboxylesterase [Labedella gwakjiensis]|nr:alpha/beta fold hydrolase [Labedella gwakjiensis]PSL37743.1 phospholipase/carboxylesterase [Labedella gwakjiensis]
MSTPMDDALWSRDDDGTSPLVVLLHGQGGTERDLAPVFPLLPPEVVAVSLRGTHPDGAGFSWFVTPEGVREATAEHVAPAADALIALTRSLTSDPSDPDDPDAAGRRPVALVGYSQGGAVAIHVLRRAPRSVDTAVILAGFLGVGDEPGDDELLDVRPPVFWMRGLRDESNTLMDVQRVAYFLPPHSTLTTAEHPLLGHELSEPFFAATARSVSAWAARLPGPA